MASNLLRRGDHGTIATDTGGLESRVRFGSLHRKVASASLRLDRQQLIFELEGVLVEHHRLHHYDSSEIMWVNHVILLHLGPSFEMEFENDGEIYRKELQPGQISFYPALTHCRHRSLQPTEFALISLCPEFVSIACCDMFALDSIKWARQTGISDSYAESVCRALLKETLGGSPTGSMYAQSLATSLAVHLASQYGGTEVCSQQKRWLISQSAQAVHRICSPQSG